MQYEAVVADEEVSATEKNEDPDEVPIVRQRRAMYACFAVFLATKVLVLCWILTRSIPLDPIRSLLRGEWWSFERD